MDRLAIERAQLLKGCCDRRGREGSRLRTPAVGENAYWRATLAKPVLVEPVPVKPFLVKPGHQHGGTRRRRYGVFKDFHETIVGLGAQDSQEIFPKYGPGVAMA